MRNEVMLDSNKFHGLESEYKLNKTIKQASNTYLLWSYPQHISISGFFAIGQKLATTMLIASIFVVDISIPTRCQTIV